MTHLSTWKFLALGGAVSLILVACGSGETRTWTAPSTQGPVDCVPGQPCSCGTAAQGVTGCGYYASYCDCASCRDSWPAEGEGTACFEPCGGDPYGSWVLDHSCLRSNRTSDGTCDVYTHSGDNTIDAQLVANPLHLTFQVGGGLLVGGGESWTLEQEYSAGCAGAPAPPCNQQSVRAWPSNSFTGLYEKNLTTVCTESCGGCSCEANYWYGDLSSPNSSSWTRDNATISLEFPWSSAQPISHCVQGNELWLSLPSDNTDVTLAYHFKKQSCIGTPTPCIQRGVADCEIGGYCSLGACQATTGTNCSAVHSKDVCNTTPGCNWNEAACMGTAPSACDLAKCGGEPGCAWHEPVQRCAGTATSCTGRAQSACTASLGCTYTVCQSYSNQPECWMITSTSGCSAVVGCYALDQTDGDQCGGTAAPCSQQTNPGGCTSVGCNATPACTGTPTSCASLSVADCPNQPGCAVTE
jgi:hypothetical protein